jgi:hypothetical protein
MDSLPIYHHMEQNSEEWYAIRLGRATGSGFKNVLAKLKSGEASTRRNYRSQLICERLTGQRTETYTSAAMLWGKEWEGVAREAYETSVGVLIEQVGFAEHPYLMAGASPDGLIGDDGAVEIKCPLPATHIDALINGTKGYVAEIQGGMWITGRQWCDFVSYSPLFPKHLQLVVERVPRDQEYINNLESEVAKFLTEMEVVLDKLDKMGDDNGIS